jgi:hypothetical protein
MAVFAVSAVVATAAQAVEGGPRWIATNGLPKNIKSQSIGAFKLANATQNVTCEKANSVSGNIKGTNPGTDESTILFTGCIAEGKPTCHATGPGKAKESGEIEVAVKTVLVYPDGKKDSTTEANDAFFPAVEGSNEFVSFTFEGAGCGFLLNKMVAHVTATGTEVNEAPYKYKNRCGVIAEVGKIKAGAFERTISAEKVKEGALNFPNPAIKKGELWQPAPKTFKNIECKLEAGFLGAAEEIGLTKVETEPLDEFGWED